MMVQKYKKILQVVFSQMAVGQTGCSIHHRLKAAVQRSAVTAPSIKQTCMATILKAAIRGCG
jgi:hypothetical protein